MPGASLSGNCGSSILDLFWRFLLRRHIRTATEATTDRESWKPLLAASVRGVRTRGHRMWAAGAERILATSRPRAPRSLARMGLSVSRGGLNLGEGNLPPGDGGA